MSQPPRSTSPRRGLVLGGGGLLGAAWTVGALTAIEETFGFDARTADHILGTSAGAVNAALLASGISVAQLRDHQLGEPVDGPLAETLWDYESAAGGPRPIRPRVGMGSPGMIVRNITRLRRMPPTAVLSAFLPEGRGVLDNVGELVEAVNPADHWSPHPNLSIVAMDYDAGRRVAFGRPDSPPARLPEAVKASCAIPGWFAPIVINGRRYVDGGACSATSVDLLAGLGLDEVYVVAPAVSFETDRPRTFMSRVERTWRTRVTRRCVRESAKLRAEGTEVVVLGPGAEDLAQMGGNLMDGKRRLHVLETSIRTSAAALASKTDAVA